CVPRVRVQFALFTPHALGCQQSGNPLPSASDSSDGLRSMLPLRTAGGGGPGTGGLTLPPITSLTVLTDVPAAARGASQSRKLASVDGLTAYVPHASQTLCMTKITQPPAACSARVTAPSRLARLVH